MVKPKLGIAGRVLFKANCQGVSIITQPCKERKIREHNTDMTETRAARVDQNTRHKAESSTLYQVYRCINNIKDIVQVWLGSKRTTDGTRRTQTDASFENMMMQCI